MVVLTLFYIIVIFLAFLFIPTENFVTSAGVSGGELIYVDYSVNATQSYDTPDNVNTFDVLKGVALFNIEGIPAWLSVLAVYIPLILLGLGAYALVRGI